MNRNQASDLARSGPTRERHNKPDVAESFVASEALSALILDRLRTKKQGLRSDPLVPSVEAIPRSKWRTKRGAIADLRRLIGIRIEQMFGTLAFRAAARGVRAVQISVNGRFLPAIQEGVLRRIPVDYYCAQDVLNGLHRDLVQFASQAALAGDWGQLRCTGSSLWLEVTALISELPAEEPRARLVGGSIARKSTP